MSSILTTADLRASLSGRTRWVTDEIALQAEIAAAFTAAGIPFQREVPIGRDGRIDFIVGGDIALEVKGLGGGGLQPVRQLFRYLEDPRFRLGILLTIRPLHLPVDHYVRMDGTIVPVSQIELWKNSL